MFNDIYESIHAEDMGPVVANFHDNPVRSWDPIDSRARALVFAQEAVNNSKGAAVVDTPYIAPPERKPVTAEQDLERKGMKSHRVTIEEAVVLAEAGSFVMWRPVDGTQASEYALVAE